ncbi:MAG: hypothetical protein CMG69_03990 [Candidatus Marinimicrobia bacterium]|nr:hypothetical protein [Candidatus Neomarinimicrobiota bacterium]|tara:strand:+ start:41241 stop:41969 length:729 start_codon:yes stop_codon:yes gene_type:complete
MKKKEYDHVNSRLKVRNILQFRDGIGIRKEEFRIVYEIWKEYFDEPILEIGSGEGLQYKLLRRYFQNVIPSDVNINRWDKSLGEIRKINSEQLPFDDNSINTIYSSNVIEHIEDIKLALKEMRRVLKPDGYIIHLVPTVSWKVSHLFGYYPAKFRDLIATGKLFKPFPSVHGVSKNNFYELYNFSNRYWLKEFKNARLELKGVENLLFYTPYRFFPNILKFRRKLASYGFVSCRAYLLSKLV